MMKKTLIAAAVLASTSTAALAEISGNVSMASDYVFRGISQTGNQIAIQGGLDYAHDSGFYVGTWASNVDSSFFGGTQDPQIELDLYAGYSGELANGIGYDFGVLRYEYPGGDASGFDVDTTEVYVSGTYNDFSLSFNYTNELAFLFSTESAYYLAAGYDMSLANDIGLSFSLGFSDGDAFGTGPGASGLPDYLDWSIGVSKSVAGVDLGLTYTDNDLDVNTDCGGLEECDSKIVFSVSKSL